MAGACDKSAGKRVFKELVLGSKFFEQQLVLVFEALDLVLCLSDLEVRPQTIIIKRLSINHYKVIHLDRF
jgi:hypothetical protein